jgi:peroxiredoxin
MILKPQMMKYILTNLLAIFFSIVTSSAQLAPNFTVTDTDGKVHRLYEDYLDKGKVVVFHIFFVDCPPCNAIAPQVEALWKKWSKGNVLFIELTNKGGDNDAYVKGYKQKHGLTYPAVSADGGALNHIGAYMGGNFGPWSGTPFFAVITPQKRVFFDVLLGNIDDAIEGSGGYIGKPPATVNLSANFNGNAFPENVSLILKPKNAETPRYDLTLMTNKSHSFIYPSPTFPEMVEPEIIMESKTNEFRFLLNATDLVAIRKHILGTELFTSAKDIFASDVTGDGKVNVTDLVNLQKVILGTVAVFPNNVPSYKLYPERIPIVVPINGGVVNLNADVVKMGNVR